MFNDDDEDDEMEGWNARPLEEMLQQFTKLKKGDTTVKLEEEELEFLIDYFTESNDKANLQFAFQLGTEQFPYNSFILLRKVEWLVDQAKFGQALNVLNTVDTIDPNNLEALLLRADILTDLNKDLDAIILLEEKLPNYEVSDQCDILMSISDIHDDLEDFDKIYFTLKRILVLDPANEEALLRICFWADLTNQQEDAIQLYTTILDEQPFNALGWYNIAVAYQGLKFYEKAAECYITCIDLDDTYEYAYRNLGDTYIQLKQYEKAIEVLEKHLGLGNPEDVILEAIGYCWEKKKDFSKARNFYREASKLNPSDDSIFYKIAETYTKENQWDKAIKNYDVALKLDSTNTTYCIALGNCLLEINKSKDAIALFLNAVRLKPLVKTTWLALLRGLYLSGYYAEAKSQMQMAIDCVGFKPELDYYNAALLLALGKTKEASVILEQALHDYPSKLSCLNALNKEIIHHPSFAIIISNFKKRNK